MQIERREKSLKMEEDAEQYKYLYSTLQAMENLNDLKSDILQDLSHDILYDIKKMEKEGYLFCYHLLNTTHYYLSDSGKKLLSLMDKNKDIPE